MDWIRCCNPTCGKWRACLRTMDARVLRDMYPVWHCWMNTWDDARASCNAPQEGTVVRSLAESRGASGKAERGPVSSGDDRKEELDGDSIDGEIIDDEEDEIEDVDFPDKDPGEYSAPSVRGSGVVKGGTGNAAAADAAASASAANDFGMPELVTQGISSKGRQIKSRWNTRQIARK